MLSFFSHYVLNKAGDFMSKVI